MSAAQLAARAQAEMASRLLARRRLLAFVQRFNPRYQAGWVHEDVCRRLEQFSRDVDAGLSPRLMLLMPPRHGKSELASRCFPAWHLGHYPDHEFIATSYNVSLAMSFSRKVKEVMQDPSYHGVFDTRLHPDMQSAEEWAIAGRRGGYVAAGTGGGITGKGAHVLVIDDPIKNSEEADSADARDKLWEWYGSTAYTRLAPGGGVLVVQTWWNDDDLAGRLQSAMRQDPEADQFTVVKYPAIAEADEYLDYDTDLIVYDQPPENGRLLRQRGDALHPQRYDLKKLNRIRRTIPARFWSALYQQNPVPDEGIFFEREQFHRAEPPHASQARVYVAFDFAISEKRSNDYTVGVVGLHTPDDLLHVVDRVRFKSGDAFQIVESMLNLIARWSAHGVVHLGVEDGQIWRALAAVFARRSRERRVFVALKPLRPLTDKLTRARPLQARMQQGSVIFSDKGDWYDEMRLELLRFPAGAHDDQVDALAWLAQMSIETPPPSRMAQRGVKSWRDKLAGGARSGSFMGA